MMLTKLARRGLIAAIAILGLAGCSAEVAEEQISANMLPPIMNPITEVNQSLRDLPPPSHKVAVAVYNYTDQTGQFKQSDTTQTLSKAVTQGATSILIKALQDVGQGSWFTVVERERIDNLLKERSIITQMRMTYLGEKQVNPQAVPPLLFAAIIFEGGIIGYDTNIQTGGLGAKLLGIGGDIKYRLDTITIYLRAVSTKTGEVLGSVTTHKTLASVGLQGGVFKFIAVDKILEGEAGITKNEPEQLAVQQAIEKAVYAMMLEGAEAGVWSFADKADQDRLIGTYRSGEGSTTETVSTWRTEETSSTSAPPTAQLIGHPSDQAGFAALAAVPKAAPGALDIRTARGAELRERHTAAAAPPRPAPARHRTHAAESGAAAWGASVTSVRDQYGAQTTSK